MREGERKNTSRAALDALDAGVVVLDESGRVELSNRRANELLGMPPEVLHSAHAAEIFGPLSTLTADPTEKFRDPRREVRIRLPDGKTLEAGLSVTRFTDQGVEKHAILFQSLEGINELRQERDRLLQLAAVGAALPSVLHELRNPLAAMTTLLEVMLEEPPGPLTSDLQLMLSEVRRLSLTLQGLGGIVRSAKAERSAAIDLAVRDACRILEPMASRKGVSLEAVGPALPTLPIDPEVLSGVIFNLVTNAIEACSDGGSVVVDCRLEGDSVFKLSVCDSGSGMSPESLARSTEMFFSTKNKGSGLGLTLCNRIAEVSNGRLEIDSAIGQGTRITMHIPLNQPQNN